MSGPFKMKGYSYPGDSPVTKKTDKPIDKDPFGDEHLKGLTNEPKTHMLRKLEPKTEVLTARLRSSRKIAKRFIPNVPLDPNPNVSAVNPTKGSVHPEVRQIKTIRG